MIKKIIPFVKTKLYYLKQSWRKKYPDVAKLRAEYSTHIPLLLHFGCGPRVLTGWINIDLKFMPYEKHFQHYDDMISDNLLGGKKSFYAFNVIETGLPLPDNSVDAIFHEDFIEHISQRDQMVFLAETLRVLKPGGIHRVNTPDLAEAMKKSDFLKGKDGVYVNEWDRHRHLSILTKHSLREMAGMVGYGKVEFNERNKSVCSYIPQEYRPGNDRPENGNIFADLTK